MLRDLALIALTLIGAAACSPTAQECAADPKAVDERAIARTLSGLAPDQPLTDGPRSASILELRSAGLTFEGEKPLESDAAAKSLFSYRSRTDPPVQFSVMRDSRDACHRHVSWRILDRQVATEQ